MGRTGGFVSVVIGGIAVIAVTSLLLKNAKGVGIIATGLGQSVGTVSKTFQGG